MALLIDYTQDLIVDEDQLLPVNDPDETLLPATGSIADALALIDTTNDFATGLATPQAAMENSFFTIDNTGGTVTGLSLSLAGGVAYPTVAGTGILAPFTTASGQSIYLYQGPTTDTVKAVIGDDPAGDVAFVIHLDEVSSGGSLTGANLWIVQYEPVYHPDGSSVEGDLLDLTDLVYVATVAVSTAVASDFSDVPAGAPIFAMIADDGAGDVQFLCTAYKTSAPTTGITVNVSNQGSFPGSLASGSQNITPGTALRFDLVTGGDTVYTQTEGKMASNIVYSDHADDITQAGFTIVQNQGGRPTDCLITAYTIPDDMDGSNTDSTAFFGSLGNQGPAEEIDAVRIYVINPVTGLPVAGSDHTYLRSAGNVAGVITFNADGTVTALNLGLNSTVEIIVDEGGLDRFTVANVDSQQNAYIDIGRLTYTSSQTSQDAQEIGSRIMIDDSGPTITALGVDAQSLLTDDTTLGPDSTDFSGVFDIDFGSDGEGSSGATYALSTAGGATGLYDMASGEEVSIAQDGDDLVGTVNGGADVVFVISVDTATGVVTLDQQRAIQHLDGGAETDVAATLTGANLVVLTVTAVDADTDEDSDSVDITAALAFDDDDPTVSLTATDIPALTTDDDTLGSDSAEFSVLFDADFGNDGEGAGGTSYALGVNAGGTGLADCATGEEIQLKYEGGAVIGYVGVDTEVFRVTVDANTGEVTLTRYRAIEHIVAGVPTDDALTLASADLITLTATVEDGDKDTADATADIGTSLWFDDAQPEFTDPADDLTVDFSTGSSGSETFALDFHNDTPGSVSIVAGSLVYDGPFTPVVTDTTIEFWDGTTLIYHLDLTDTDYTVTIDSAPPSGSTDLNFDAIKAGGPQETLAVPLVDNSDTIVFNGLIDGVEWNSNDRDFLNPDSLGFGLKGGQASQINPHEGFWFYNTGSEGIDSLNFGIQGIGNIPSVTVHFQLYEDVNNTPGILTDDVAIVGGSGTLVVTGLAAGNIVKYVDIAVAGIEYDSALVTFDFPALNKDGTQKANQGVRVLDFSTEINDDPISDAFSFEIQGVDCDQDTVTSDLVTVTLDPFFI